MAKPQYDGPWRRIRLEVLERDGWRCQIIGPKCKHIADQVDHIVAIENGGSWWDKSNLRASCGPCNNGRSKGHERWRRTNTEIVLVVGPPGSGKSTHVETARGQHDLVIDYDAIATALGSNVDHDHNDSLHRPAMAARNALITTLRRGEVTAPRAWIISSNPKAESMFPHHRVVTVDPGRDAAKQRATTAGRPARWQQLIDDWYQTRSPSQSSQVKASRDW